ncbi:MAG: hypothetical protein HRT43_12870, partial [Campylobacteraceae bacterium]|nr:hypothetical protein [Campylobacteraceae bacterium]
MKLVFVHGWSVTSIDTYGELPEVLKREAPSELNLEIENIYLGEYISFHDEVSLDDIARAFESARIEKLGDESFACITHSTGGPIIRLWIDLFFKDDLSNVPLSHLVMLAPANHGSSLAVLGKKRVGRIKSWFEDVEPGVGVLNWLQLGSKGQWELNNSYLDYKYSKDTFFPFVLSGETIDTEFYDFINRYLVEEGSDGVIRLSAANLNYKVLQLEQDCRDDAFDAIVDGHTIKAYPLKQLGKIQTSPPSAFEVIPNASHSGKIMGIMQSVKLKNNFAPPLVNSIINSLRISSNKQYNTLLKNMHKQNKRTQKDNQKCDRYIMFVFSIKDNFGNEVSDYDMILLAGKKYKPSTLPK